jgi:hypothetical protein
VYAAAAAVAFLTELAAIAALAYAGAQASLALGVLLPVAFVVVWALVASPRARVQLSVRPKVAVRCTLLLASALALGLAGQWPLALVLAAVVVVDQAVLVALGRPVAGAG